MKKYTANYCNSDSNFVILGIKDIDKVVKYIKTIKIVKNIITRGNPTIMSDYLKKYYKYDLKIDNEFLKLISNENSNWKNTIKGVEGSFDNPALDFYENILEEYLNENKIVKNLILPEAEINSIIERPIKEFNSRCVDFFLPQANLVIEIDGIQHKKSKLEDENRDRVLQNSHIDVIRIDAKDIREKNDNLSHKMDEINKKIFESEIIDKYNFKNVYDENNKEKVELINIIRIQILIIELLKNAYINFDEEWNFEIKGISEKIFRIAIGDLKNWFELVFNLQKIKIDFPQLSINKDNKNNIKIDIDILKRYDENCYDEKIIYIRNDYFDNEQKNYYEVECDDVYRYNLKDKDPMDKKNLQKIVKNIFGYEDLREGQPSIIMNCLNLNDTIGILPTGTGKSLCYQISVLLQPGISFIVCPLKSLIKDQKDNMDEIFINNTAKLDSTMDGKEKSQIISLIKKSKYQMIWCSPERFQSEDFRKGLEHINKNFSITYAVVDEVHCLSEWGHNFRTSYLHLVSTIRRFLPATTIVGLTATASENVIQDLKNEFEMEDEKNIITTLNFIRKELEFYIFNVKENEKEEALFNIIQKLQNNREVLDIKNNENLSGIIFTPFASGKRGAIQLCNRIADKYSKYKDNISYFIGSNAKKDSHLTDSQLDVYKNKVQNEFKKDLKTLLVSTKSFGMGIDKGNIRYIIHFGIPNSMESLYQEAGRAGRDGKKSMCYIIHAIPEYYLKDEEILFKNNSEIDEIKEVLGCEKTYSEAEEIYDFYTSPKKYNKINNKSSNEINIFMHKLKILGLIDDKSNDISTLSFNYIATEEIKENLLKYINKFEKEFSFEKTSRYSYKYIYEILNDHKKNELKKYIEILCMWYDENIIYNNGVDIKLNKRKSVKFIEKYNAWSRGDIFDQMIFFCSNQEDEEIDKIYFFYKKFIFNKNEFEIKMRTEKELGEVEKYVYKLSLLGIVNDWTISYNPWNSIIGKSSNLNENEIKNNLEKYINKYDKNFSFNKIDIKKYGYIVDILKNDAKDTIYKYIEIVYRWYYENILYNKRKAIQNIDNYISTMNGNCTEQMNRLILDYFRPDNYALKLKALANKNEDYLSALSLFYEQGKFIKIEKIKSIKITLDRFLETNRYNSTYILINGLFKMFLGEFNDKIDVEDFDYVLNKTKISEDKEEIYEKLLELTSKMEEDYKEILNQMLIRKFDTLEDLTKNYNYLKLNSSLNKILEIHYKKIIEIEGEALNGNR